MIYNGKIRKAALLAYKVHAGELDKGGYPYILHPIHLAEQMDTEDEIIVALLHDVLESDRSTATYDYINLLGFSDEVIEAIHIITRNPDDSYFDYIEKVKNNKLARKVKIADIKHNLRLDRLRSKEFSDSLVERYNKAIEILS